MGERRFPAPWRVEATPSGFRIIDANGQAVAYTYGIRPDEQRTDTGGKLTIKLRDDNEAIPFANPVLKGWPVQTVELFPQMGEEGSPHARPGARSTVSPYRADWQRAQRFLGST